MHPILIQCLTNVPLLGLFNTWIVVDAVSIINTSVQLIIIPFRPIVSGSIVNLDTNGMMPLAEILEKVNEVEFITDVSSFSELASIARYKSMKIVAGANVHASKLLPGSVNEHISSSWSPAHTSEFPEGDIVTAP